MKQPQSSSADVRASSRREFLRNSSLAAAGAAALSQAPWVITAHAASDMPIKIGVIGCGGRGTGAALDAIGAATKVIYPSSGYHTEDVAQAGPVQRKDIQIVALADVFPDRLKACREQLGKLQINIPDEHCFSGFDAYKKLLTIQEVNYVILATPPHFRPEHLRASIEAGKNVFMEKPVAVDAPGVRTVIAAGELAKQKGLGIAAGTQRRHLPGYNELVKRLQDGAIGDILYARAYWNGGTIWVIDRQPGWTDMEWQLRNWNYFTWLSGDHYVEQHVHNIDVVNWVMGGPPIKAYGMGGRQARQFPIHGHIYDHFAVEYEYANGARMFSQARQMSGCDGRVQEDFVGVRGTATTQGGRYVILPKPGERWRYAGQDPNAYQQEHQNLIASIRAGKPINEAKAIAESTMTAIMGRESAYSGQAVEWEQALASTTRLGPANYEMGPLPFPEVAIPGKYKPA